MDCLEGMRLIPDKSVDMILCDLPYGITACQWDKVIPFEPLWDAYRRVIKLNGVIALTATQPFATDLINHARKMFRYDLIWEKSMAVGFANANRMPMRKHEYVLIFYSRLPTYHPQGLVELPRPQVHHKLNYKGGVYHSGSLQNPYTSRYTNYPKSVIHFSNGNHKSLHPTQKPVELFEYLIRTYTSEGETVLDNCMGSGTTAVACVNTGRSYIGFETDPEYCRLAEERIQEIYKQMET